MANNSNLIQGGMINATRGTHNPNLVEQAKPDRVPKTELGKDEFLKILVMQLGNQDPLEPVKDTEFIAQMAQFSSLEQMQAMNQTMTSNMTYGMIGKSVYAEIQQQDGSKLPILGVVSGVERNGGVDYLCVGDKLVPLKSVKGVYTQGDTSSITQGSNLIGKFAYGIVPDPTEEDPSAVKKVSGTISGVSMKNGVLYAKIGDEDVPVTYINNVYDKEPAIPPEGHEKPPVEGGDEKPTEP